jgi:hypothetical protein
MGTWNEYLDIRMKLGVHEAWCADNVKLLQKRSNISAGVEVA